MVTAFEIGQRAESAAVRFLNHKGCTVVVRNWRTRWCEIDIIASRATTLFFCEVKYRSQPAWGRGFDYITPQKLRQMRFAADFWLAANNWSGDCRLSAIEVSGPQFEITGAVSDLSSV